MGGWLAGAKIFTLRETPLVDFSLAREYASIRVQILPLVRSVLKFDLYGR